MKKHAYLIMAYNNPNQLVKLITLLDDSRNDIYIHIDKKSDFPMDIFESLTSKSQLTVVPRVSVRWAHFSQVEAEMILLSYAIKNNKYHYYHLLSGMDLPLKSQDEIHSFFSDKNCEFIGIVPNESEYNLRHIMCRYPLLALNSYRKSKVLRGISEAFAKIQFLFYRLGVCGKNRQIHKRGMRFYDGWQWFSITDEFANYLLDKQDFIKKMFSSAKAPDEMVLQTMAMNSKFADRLFNADDLCKGSMRYIDWKRGSPYVFRNSDYDELVCSPYIFARKLDERVDAEVIDRIFNYISHKQLN